MLEGFRAALHYEKPVTVEGISLIAAALHVKIKETHVLASGRVYGNEHYKQAALSIALARKLGNVSLGIRSIVYRDAIKGYSSQNSIRVGVSSMLKLTKEVSIYLQATNIGWASHTPQSTHALVIDGGLMYDASDMVNVSIGWRKQRESPPVGHFHVVYIPADKITVGAGYLTNINGMYLSVGYPLKAIKLSVSIRYDPVLGCMPGLMLFN